MFEATTREVADALGVTPGRINQIERTALAKVRAAIAAHPQRAQIEQWIRDRLSEDRHRHPLDRDL